MKQSINLIITLTVCIFFASCAQAEIIDDSNVKDGTAVTIVLNKFEVTDANLELGWKIQNNSDHEIWICESLYWTSAKSEVEVFLDKDATTLVIRRQLNLPIETGILWEKNILKGVFVPLRPGQEKIESFSLDVPVEPNVMFSILHANSEFANRLSLEIGFFDEDLRDLILRVVELAEKLKCDNTSNNPSIDPNYIDVFPRFFKGVYTAGFFHSFGYFRDSVLSGGDEIIIPHTGLTWPLLNGEQTLKIEINHVSIPYKSSYPPLTSKNMKKTENKQEKLRSEQNKNKPDLEDRSDRSAVAKK